MIEFLLEIIEWISMQVASNQVEELGDTIQATGPLWTYIMEPLTRLAMKDPMYAIIVAAIAIILIIIAILIIRWVIYLIKDELWL